MDRIGFGPGIVVEVRGAEGGAKKIGGVGGTVLKVDKQVFILRAIAVPRTSAGMPDAPGRAVDPPQTVNPNTP